MRKVMVVIALVSVAAIGCGDDPNAPADAGSSERTGWSDQTCDRDWECRTDAGQRGECRPVCGYCERKQCFYGNPDSG